MTIRILEGDALGYLSLFSGVEAAHLAWRDLDWRCAGVAEIEPNACAVLAHRLPNAPNLGDITKITDAQIAALGHIDVVIGGSPCQDLSVAGKRAGLAGARSSLFHEQLRIFHAARRNCGARFLVWENVPGAFSSNAGRDFAVVVGSMAGLELDVPADGWGTEGMALGENGLVEWSVLDAQWFGVAQRRRRVFAVLDTGKWADRPPILLEPESLRGDSAPRREAGEGVAPTISARTQGGGGLGTDFECDGGLIAGTVSSKWANGSGGPAGDECQNLVAHTLCADGFDASEDGTGRGTPLGPVVEPYTLAIRGRGDESVLEYRQDGTANALLTPSGGRGGIGVGAIALSCKDHGADGFDASEDGTGRGTPLVATYAIITGQTGANGSNVSVEVSPTIDCASPHAIAFDCKASGRNGFGIGEVSPTLRSMSHADSHQNAGGQVAVHNGMCVRRLTPRECERLQGMPDDWTIVPNAKGKPMADGPRYKMLGNSFAVPCVRWIGEQIHKARRVCGDSPLFSEVG